MNQISFAAFQIFGFVIFYYVNLLRDYIYLNVFIFLLPNTRAYNSINQIMKQLLSFSKQRKQSNS